MPQKEVKKSRRFWSFTRARSYVRKLGFKGTGEWHDWLQSGNRPSYIPANPALVYQNEGWVNMRDWLGNNWMSYRQAKNYMKDLGLKTSTEYKQWAKSGNRPSTIPSSPENFYKDNGWKNWGDYLSAPKRFKYKNFRNARAYVKTQKIANQQDWFKWCQSGKKPEDIPMNPHYVYRNSGWVNWRDWLGPQNKWMSYSEAKALLKPLKLRHQSDFIQWCRKGSRPKRMPANPKKVYAEKWKDWQDFLSVKPQKRWRDFNEARDFARSLNLKTYKEWLIWVKSGEKPYDIPSNPYALYGKQFKGWRNWLGTRKARRKKKP